MSKRHKCNPIKYYEQWNYYSLRPTVTLRKINVLAKRICGKYNLAAEIKSDLSRTVTTKRSNEFQFMDDGSCRLRLKCNGTRAETRFRFSAKRTSPFKSVGASVQSTTGSRSVRISGSNAGYTMFRGSVKSTGYPLHSTVSPSLLLPCVTVCHHISTGLYIK
jgi:hypothetical protein